MTNSEFDTVTALAHVRTIRNAVETLDTFVNSEWVIDDTEHALMRRTAREWERKLLATIKVRQQRSDAQLPLKEPQ